MDKQIHFKLFIVIVLIAGQSLFAQRTIRMNIERIISDAAIIVHGTVTKVESASDPKTHILSTFVTIDVIENLYGADRQQITIKMVGGSSKTRTIKFAEMPQFKVGEEIISMFFAPSKSGFTSPVGMSQGTFTVQTDETSKKKIIRLSSAPSQLFAGIKHSSALTKTDWDSSTDHNIDAADFTQSVRNLVSLLKK